jgi:hypothetical protein
MVAAGWACESSCFHNNPQPDLNEGLGSLEIKPESLRYTVCATSDLLADASFNVESWILDKVSRGFRATINAAILLGDGIGKPFGLLNPNSGIPICEVSPATAPGHFTWRDLTMPKFQIPMQWMDGSGFPHEPKHLRVVAKHVLGRGPSAVWSNGYDDARYRFLVCPLRFASSVSCPMLLPASRRFCGRLICSCGARP